MTTIGKSLIITGDITSQEDITIHGRVKGQIKMEKGSLVVAETGTVEAAVFGTNITIQGTVEGDVTASERVEVAATGNVSGTVSTPSLVLQDGASFNGMIDMTARKAATAKETMKAA